MLAAELHVQAESPEPAAPCARAAVATSSAARVLASLRVSSHGLLAGTGVSSLTINGRVAWWVAWRWSTFSDEMDDGAGRLMPQLSGCISPKTSSGCSAYIVCRPGSNHRAPKRRERGSTPESIGGRNAALLDSRWRNCSSSR